MQGKSSTGRQRTLRRAATAVLVVLCTVAGACSTGQPRAEARAPIVIGVMLPLSGPDDFGWKQPLEWALDAVNDAGGVAGRKVELRYVDIAVEDVKASAERLAADESVVAVIGPHRSRLVFDVAPIFLAAKKPLISPSSTSGDVTRAFAGSRFIWRTTSSDIGQLQTMLIQLVERDVSDVALLTTFDAYGSTFFDWFGFLATELGMNVTHIERMQRDSDCAEPVARLRASRPKVVIVVPSQVSMAECVARQMPDRSEIDLLFSDGAMAPALIDHLGPLAEGLHGVGLAPDPTAGFPEAYQRDLGRSPVPFAANTYDALLLLAFGLERSKGLGSDQLVDGIIELTSAPGPPTGWDHAGIADVLGKIRAGELPNIRGTTGDLDYGDRAQIDLLSSYYAPWRVEGGAFRLDVARSTDPEAHEGKAYAESLFRARGSERRVSALTTADAPPPPEPRTGMWALIVAGSSGWENYRHQADALAQYRLLRRAGLPDDRIVLVLADDIADAPENPEPGVVRHAVDGPDLYEDVEVDYELASVRAPDILDILAGKRSARLPIVVDSTSGDDIYVYFSGHGSDQGMFIGANQAADRVGPSSFVSPEDLAATITGMDSENRYRRVLVAVEMCEAGAMGRALTAPHALVIGAANDYENSVATNWSPKHNAWLGDQFSVALTAQIELDPSGSLGELYRETYLGVAGSHVSVANATNFSNLESVDRSELFGP